MDHFDFKSRNFFSGPHMLGPVLIVAGLFALVSPLLFESETALEMTVGVGLVAIAFGLLIVFSYSGTLIDFAENKSKAYWSMVGFKFGDWSVLPKIQHVKVITKNYKITHTPNGISPTFTGKVTDFRMLLYASGSKPVLSFTYAKKDKAVQHAQQLAAAFKADLTLHIP